MINPKLRGIIFTTAAAAIVAGCGADEIASPGTGDNVTINNNTTNPPPPPPPPPPPTVTLVTPAGGCPVITDPQGLADNGTVTGPTGTYRVCTLPTRLNVSSSLPRIGGLLYRIAGRVDVGTDQGPTEEATDPANVILTVAPGVILFSESGPSWININRGNQIVANGTAALPIIFTSRANVENNAQDPITDNSSGQWGGVVLSGRAPVTDCFSPGAAPGTIACDRQVEGAFDPARFGGATGNDNSGTMRFVQIRYSGFILSGNAELQALTTGGTGSGTTLENIQSHNSSDDGMEFFGGVVNARNFAITGAEDDSLDTDVGIKANFQYVVAVQRTSTTVGDSIIEADSDNAVDGDLPRQNTRISNFTFVQRRATPGNGTAILLRGGTDYALVNGVLVSPNTTCLTISRAQTASTVVNAAIDEVGAPIFRSVVLQCGATPFGGVSGVTVADVQAIFGSGSNGNNSAFTPTLTASFANGANETAVTAFDAATLNPFFMTTTFIGAIRDANDTRFQGWTCNSATANFGGTGSACTTLPTI